MTKTALTALTTAVLLALGAPAYASHGGDDPAGDDHGGHGGGAAASVRSGTCSDGSRWTLKAKPDDGRLEVEAEVDSNRPGQTWRWRIKDEGAVAASGTATTGGRSGSFSVERRVANHAGTERITFRATHGGEVCAGSLVL